MKAIKDIAEKYAKKVNGDYYNQLYPDSDKTIGEVCIQDFEAGVKFAEEWIPVEEELPDAENEANGLSKVVIAKCKKFPDEVSAYYDTIAKRWKTYPCGQVIKVIKWRPIERLQ